jgi:WD40 repeat protein
MIRKARTGRWTACCLLIAACCLVPSALCHGTVSDHDMEGWGEVTALAFMPDGKTAIAAFQDDNKLRIYDVASGKERLTIDAHKQGVWTAVPSPDGKFVATGGGDNLIRLWDAATFKEIRSFAGHTKEVTALAFSPDSKTLASGGADHNIRTWDIATAKELKMWTGHELKVLSVAFSPDGKLLASGGLCSNAIPGFPQGTTHADQARIFDAQTGKEIRKLSQRGTTVCFTPDGRALAVAGNYVTAIPHEGGSVSVYRGTKATLVPVAKEGEWVAIKGVGGALALSPDGRLLAIAYGSQIQQAKALGKGGRNWIEDEVVHHRVSLWETATGKEIMQIPEDWATVVAISPDGRTLAVGSSSGKVQFKDLAPEEWPYSRKAPKLDTEELNKLWNDMAQPAAVPAYKAIWTLTAAGPPAVAFLSDKLRPEKSEAGVANDLLVKLDSDKYAVREAAFRDLKKLGPAIEGELRKTVADSKTSTEVRKRVQNLLDGWEKRPASPDEVRQARSLQVLERIATPEARAVLVRLGEGAPGAWLTEQARLAEKRLASR